MAVTEELKIVIRAEAAGAVRELRQVQGASAKVATNFGSIARSLIGPLGVAAGIIGLTRGVTKFLTQGVRFNAQLEQLDVAFTSILGSASAANSLVEELKEFSASTPFQMMDLAQGTQILLGFGTAAEDIVDTLRDLGNASLGSQEKLNRLIQAYGKLQSKGKATLEELNMFTEAGVPIMQALREQLGLTKEELSKYISTGKLGFEEVDAALQSLTRGEGKLAGILEGQSKTLAGSVSTLKDNVTLLTASLTEEFLPEMTESVNKLTEFVSGITAARNAAKGERDTRRAARGGDFFDFTLPLLEQIELAESGIATLEEDLINLQDTLTKEEGRLIKSEGMTALISREIAASEETLKGLVAFVDSREEAVAKARELAKEEAAIAAVQKATADRQVTNLNRLAEAYAKTEQGAIDALSKELAFFEGLSIRGEQTIEIIRTIRAELDGLVTAQQIGGATKANVGKPIPGGLLPQTFALIPNINPFEGIEQGVGNLNADDFGVPALTENVVGLGLAFLTLDQQLAITGIKFDEFVVSAADIKEAMVDLAEKGSMKLAVSLFTEFGNALATGGDMGEFFLKSVGKILGMMAEIFLWGAMSAFKDGFTELGVGFLIAAGVTGFFGGVMGGLGSTKAPSSASVGRSASRSGSRGTVYGVGDNIQNPVIIQNIAGSVLVEDQLQANAANAVRLVTSGR